MIITVYSKSNCPNCESAKALLRSKGLVYGEVSLEREEERKGFYETFPGIKQMPAIFIDGQYVGGLAGLQAALKQLGITPSA